MNTWEILQKLIHRFWDITDAPINVYAADHKAPIELYSFAELGLDYWSREDFKNRDVYSVWPDLEDMFARLMAGGWLVKAYGDRYRVTDRAQAAVQGMTRAGDQFLGQLRPIPVELLIQLVGQLRLVVDMCIAAPSPPHKWAILNRFRGIDTSTPPLGLVREMCMDLYAYRDDVHLYAWRGTYPMEGYVWNTLSLVWTGQAVTPEAMAQKLAFRGYVAADYRRSLEHLITLGWVQFDGEAYAITEQGSTVRSKVENLTDEYFYRPWGVLTGDTWTVMHNLLVSLLAGLQDQ